jgi:hypothetical protein
MTAWHYKFEDSTSVVLTARRRHAIEVSIVGLQQAVRNLLPVSSSHRMQDSFLTLRFDLEDDRTIRAVEVPITAQGQGSFGRLKSRCRNGRNSQSRKDVRARRD